MFCKRNFHAVVVCLVFFEGGEFIFIIFLFFQSLCWNHSKVAYVAGGIVSVLNNVLAAEPLRRAARRIGRSAREIIPPATKANFKVWPPINCKLVSRYSKTVHIYGIYPDQNEMH